MTENQRMQKVFADLFDGDPWLDSSLIGTLNEISAEKAARKPKNAVNSIWEITNHVSDWREVVLDRIHGSPANTPSHNYFLPVRDTSAEAWKKSIEKLKKTQVTWMDFLGEVSQEKLSEPYLDSNYTVYDLVFGIMQHDAYHLGQLALLAKYEI